MNRQPLSITPRGLVGTVIVMIIAATCVRLGFWQLDRRTERSGRNAGIESRLSDPPVEMSDAPRDTVGWLYRRVSLAGVPDAERAIVLPGRMYRGSPGVHVLVPVRLTTGDPVMVDVGWVPSADGATVDFDALSLTEPIRGIALVRPFPGEEASAPAPIRQTPPTDGFRRVWYSIDPEAMREQFPYGLAAVLLQLLPESASTGYPLRQPAPPLDAGPHLGYAIQWFSFATIALVGWLAMVTRSRSVGLGNRDVS